MKKSKKKTEKEEEGAEGALPDELNELQKFIKKQHLQQKILKKLIDDLQSVQPQEFDNQQSA